MSVVIENHTKKFYRRRDPFASPLWKVVNRYYDEFERVYPERYEKTYGYWRPVIGDVIAKFLTCCDIREGFARVRCCDCGKEYFVPFSCNSGYSVLAVLKKGSSQLQIIYRKWFVKRFSIVSLYLPFPRGYEYILGMTENCLKSSQSLAGKSSRKSIRLL